MRPDAATTAALRAATIAAATACIGIHEEPPGSNRGVLIDEALRFVGVDPTKGVVNDHQWCAAFACLMLRRGGVQHGPKTPSTGGIAIWGVRNGARVIVAQKGDVGLLKDATSPTGYRHTVLITGGDGDTYSTLEGNLRDGIYWNVRRADSLDYVNPYVCG